MRRLTYMLQFHRAAYSGKVEAPTVAYSLAVTTLIGSHGITSEFVRCGGEHASMVSQYVLNGDQTQFFEWGTITLGASENTLTFASISAGTLLGKLNPTEGFSLGGVLWRITGGTGFLAGATGQITSNFLIDLESNELIDHQIHVVYLP